MSDPAVIQAEAQEVRRKLKNRKKWYEMKTFFDSVTVRPKVTYVKAAPRP